MGFRWDLAGIYMGFPDFLFLSQLGLYNIWRNLNLESFKEVSVN